MITKVCKYCRIEKRLDEFHKDKNTKDGHVNRCKVCKKQYTKQYYQENAESRKQYQKQHYQENTEKYKQYGKDYHQENKEYHQQYRKQYYHENMEHEKQRNKQYRQENVEYHKRYRKQYLQSERGREILYKHVVKRRSNKHEVNFKPFERKQILDRDNWECQSCGIKVHDRSTGDWNTPNKAHMDHIIPISKGGNSEAKNLRILCRTCNLSKNDKVDEQLQLFN